MRIWNGLTPHSIVLYRGIMWKITNLYVKDEKKYADLLNGANEECKEVDIMELERVDD